MRKEFAGEILTKLVAAEEVAGDGKEVAGDGKEIPTMKTTHKSEHQPNASKLKNYVHI